MIICQVVPSIFRVSLPLLPRYEKGYRLFEWLTPITYRMIKKRSPFSLSQTPSAVFKSVCPSHFKRRVSHLLLAPHLSNLLLAPIRYVAKKMVGGGGNLVWPNPRQREQPAAALAPTKSIDPAQRFLRYDNHKIFPNSCCNSLCSAFTLDIWFVSIGLLCLWYGVRDGVY